MEFGAVQPGGPAASADEQAMEFGTVQPGGPGVGVDEQTLEFGAITGKGSVRSRRPRARPIRIDGPERLATADTGDEFPPPTIAALCDEFAEICESAVDALEIASALEFAGISDRTARLRYGTGVDVFVLAQEMYFRVPRRPAEPEPPPDPWRHVSKFQPALRGLLYALPAVCFPAAGALLAGPGARPVLGVALLAGWGRGRGRASIGSQRLRATATGPARRGVAVGRGR